MRYGPQKVNLYVEFIPENYSHLGYHFTASSHLPLLQYADDIILIASSPVTMYDATIKWLDWARMQVKVPKCRALSINRGRAVTQSSLKLDGESVPSASEAPIRFLDVPTLNTINHCTALAKQLKLYLLKIDKTTVTRRQKLKLYQLAVCAKLSCDLIKLVL